MEIKIDYQALPGIEKFHQSKATFKWLVGGVNSGKTYALAHEAIRASIDEKDNLGLVGRKTEKRLFLTVQTVILNLCDKYKIKKDYDKTNMILTLITGSKIIFMPLNLEITAYTGLELGFFIVDEASEIDTNRASYFITRLKRKNIKYVFGAFDSVYTGKNYLYKWFIQKQWDDLFAEGLDECFELNENLFEYICVKSDDNIYARPGYNAMLRRTHSKQWCEINMDCNMKSYTGELYPEFDMGKNIVIEYHNKYKDESKELLKVIGYDSGTTCPSCILVKVLDKGRKLIYTIDEVYKKNMGVAEVASNINLLQGKHQTSNIIIVDPAISRTDKTSMKSERTELMRELGKFGKYRIINADNRRKVGWERVNALFKGSSDLGKEYIFKNCKNLISEITSAKWQTSTEDEEGLNKGDEAEPEDQADHASDTNRYLDMYLTNEIILDIYKQDEVKKKRIMAMPVMKRILTRQRLKSKYGI